MHVDVLVIGAGPAGAATAAMLAPLQRVALVERRAGDATRVGESLPPAARTLLADMGLLEGFLREPHAPCYGNRALWGSPDPVDADFLLDPNGVGWHLDRARFDTWLRREAVTRGAALHCPAAVMSIAREGHWLVRLRTAAGEAELTTDLIIDAGGRSSPLARRLGARRRVADRLVSAFVHGHDAAGGAQALTLVEAVEDGWWYTAPIPSGRRVLAFQTDADLPAAREVRSPAALVARVHRASETARVLDGAGFRPEGDARVAPAHSAFLEPCAGDGWLAAGDAALAFDPLSSQGLLNALYTALAAAEAADRHLAGEGSALDDYAQALAGVREAYRENLARSYRAETRWPDAPFWLRRR